jgi:PAS domain S-box-containing protein
MNDAAVELFGYSSKDELMQVNIPDRYVKKEDRTKHINTIIEHGHAKDYPVDLLRKDGRIINTLITSAVRYDAYGKAIGIMGTIKDITERKRAEETLLVIKKAVESSSDAIGISDPHGHHFYHNKAFTELFEYTPEELDAAGGGPAVYANNDIAVEVFNAIMGGGSWSGELEMISKSGRKIPFLLRADAIKDESGKIIGLIGLHTDITERKQAEEKLLQTLDRLRKAVGTTIQVLVSAVETRDPYTSGHQLRVADLAGAIAVEMKLTQEKIEGIRMAGAIHDIGKLSIPSEILTKPSKLTDLEFSLIKEHSRSGYNMLKDVESPWPLAQITYQHHERMDGSGYPRNLKGDEILIEARIMAVADVVEAMASHRPYRPSLGIDTALAEIEKNKGTHYDGAVADACLRLFREKRFQLT